MQGIPGLYLTEVLESARPVPLNHSLVGGDQSVVGRLNTGFLQQLQSGIQETLLDLDPGAFLSSRGLERILLENLQIEVESSALLAQFLIEVGEKHHSRDERRMGLDDGLQNAHCLNSLSVNGQAHGRDVLFEGLAQIAFPLGFLSCPFCLTQLFIKIGKSFVIKRVLRVDF